MCEVKTHGLFYFALNRTNNYCELNEIDRKSSSFFPKSLPMTIQQGGEKSDSYFEWVVSLPVECAVKTKMSDTRFRATGV